MNAHTRISVRTRTHTHTRIQNTYIHIHTKALTWPGDLHGQVTPITLKSHKTHKTGIKQNQNNLSKHS